jgi:hypothetical protein
VCANDDEAIVPVPKSAAEALRLSPDDLVRGLAMIAARIGLHYAGIDREPARLLPMYTPVRRSIIAASKAVTRGITGITVRRTSQAFFDSIDPKETLTAGFPAQCITVLSHFTP